MKENLKNSLIGIGLYLLAGVFLYGYQAYMLPAFLLLTVAVSFVVFRKKNKEQVRKGLFWLCVPLLLLLFVTSLFTDNFRVMLPYLVFVPLTVVLIYYAMFQPKRIVFFAGIFVLIVVSLFTFDAISGTAEVFDSSYLEMFKKLVRR